MKFKCSLEPGLSAAISVALVVTLAATVALGTLGCSQKALINSRLTRAPRSAEQLGVVVEQVTPDEMEHILAQFPAARVRVLNPKHGMYEIFQVRADEIRSHVSARARITPNSFFSLHRAEPQRPSALINNLTSPVLNPCKTGANAPSATLESELPTRSLNLDTLSSGTRVRVRGLGSPRWRAAIYVTAPELSRTPETVHEGWEYEFIPDALGLYQITLVVQDDRDVCSYSRLRFAVTANPDLIALSALPPLSPIDLTLFDHLNQVSALEAWDLAPKRGEGVTVAIIDTGVHYNHPALRKNITVNEQEIPGNGLDDDDNGFVDDVIGFDFINQDSFPFDDESHGTHVAGLAASPEIGLASHSRLLAVKAMSPFGGDSGTVAAAIRYAIDRGAKVINLSLGERKAAPDPLLLSAVAYAQEKGALIFAAAGNGDLFTGLGFDIGVNPIFPASLPDGNIVTVGAFDRTNAISVYSNFGKDVVDILAPGGWLPNNPIRSLAYENPSGRDWLDSEGTSMATPVAAGIAALVWSENPNLDPLQLKSLLLASGPSFPELQPVTTSGRHLNARDAIQLAR